ncbi:hypothetical protein PRIPAC_74250 [Pristionchus pacificus]|uniref:Uncharacterized protein n=1 Tax=Pristionchus pacificus TaxID=54126 RepID=A0A2A6CFT9_PRIPA|nr:hypothetical protein PRIPAC_74250 [Pristionchus pacificus]|eukprot:PDM76881.1 hypothetical protein PRIPAC_42276 [Pristionchus pacificus]
MTQFTSFHTSFRPIKPPAHRSPSHIQVVDMAHSLRPTYGLGMISIDCSVPRIAFTARRTTARRDSSAAFRNDAPEPVTWTATTKLGFLSITPASGRVEAGATSAIVVSCLATTTLRHYNSLPDEVIVTSGPMADGDFIEQRFPVFYAL